MMQSEEKNREVKKNEEKEITSELWDTIKCTNICTNRRGQGKTEEVRGKAGKKNQEIMIDISNLMKNIH